MDEASQEAAKRIKADITPTFKNPGNKDQFKHEQEMKGVMEEALKAIEGNDLEKAKSKLEDGKRFIASRIKLIKMADREEDGWDVVKFYKADDLADNSDDEKNISKAKRLAAVAKKKKNFERFDKGRRNPEVGREQSRRGQDNHNYLKGDKIIIGTITICIIDIKGKNYVICATGQDIFRPTARGDMTG